MGYTQKILTTQPTPHPLPYSCPPLLEANGNWRFLRESTLLCRTRPCRPSSPSRPARSRGPSARRAGRSPAFFCGCKCNRPSFRDGRRCAKRDVATPGTPLGLGGQEVGGAQPDVLETSGMRQHHPLRQSPSTASSRVPLSEPRLGSRGPMPLALVLLLVSFDPVDRGLYHLGAVTPGTRGGPNMIGG